MGLGGMGEVHAAHDVRLGRQVALKTAHGTGGDALLREARLTARLNHPGIVPIYGAGATKDGERYYTMPVVQGRTLSEAIADADGIAERLRLVPHLIDACHAIGYAHSQGVLHRDLKPSNVMVGAFGETVVVDWGLALHLADHPAGHGGTPEYCAPEQAAGGPLDERADIFALGAILHELLVGAPPAPVRGQPMNPVVREPDAPRELVAVVRKATAPARESRYGAASELVADLQAWFEGGRVHAYGYSRWELLVRLVRAWSVPIALLAVGVVATSVAAGVGFRATTKERDRAVQAERSALAEKERSEEHLARALVSRAVAAAGAESRAEAELLAALTLETQESPLARGVLAKSLGQARPRMVSRADQPPCPRVLDAWGGRWVCADDDSVTVRALVDPMW